MFVKVNPERKNKMKKGSKPTSCSGRKNLQINKKRIVPKREDEAMIISILNEEMEKKLANKIPEI